MSLSKEKCCHSEALCSEESPTIKRRILRFAQDDSKIVLRLDSHGCFAASE